MSDIELNGWSARLPDWVDGEMDAAERKLLEEALASDPELRAEAELVRAIRESRQAPPANLSTAILDRLDEERSAIAGRSRIAAGWRMSSAAILVLAMGTAVIWQNRIGPMPTFGTPTTALQASLSDAPLSDSWLLDDGVVAGGAVLDDLSNEELSMLLDELEG